MLSKLKIKLSLILFTLLLFTQTANAQTFNLTGAWKDDNGVTYCVRQVGNRLFWRMDDRPRVHNVFYSIISNENITGEWVDLPGGQMVGNGTLALKIESNNRFVKISQTSNYLGSVWTRTNDANCSQKAPAQIPRPGGEEPSGQINLTGSWIVKSTDPYSTGEVLWEIFQIEPNKWGMNTTLLSTSHPFHKRNICKTFTGMTIKALPNGTYEYRHASVDQNPGNPGSFEQIVPLTYNPKTKILSGQGTHKGSSLTHWVKLEAKRGTDDRCKKKSGSGGTPVGGICENPRTQQIMDEWLAQAIPPQKPGESLRYESWGRLVGQSLSANLTENIPPTTTLSRCEYLWQRAANLGSTNLGTLKEYVEKRK